MVTAVEKAGVERLDLLVVAGTGVGDVTITLGQKLQKYKNIKQL